MSTRVSVRVTAEENAKLEEGAKSAHLSLNDYLRQQLGFKTEADIVKEQDQAAQAAKPPA